MGIIGKELADKKAKEATKDFDIYLIINLSKRDVRDIVSESRHSGKSSGRKRNGRWYSRIQRKVGEMRRAGRNK